MAKNDILIPAPRENPRMIGHAAAQSRFLQEFNSGLIHHAYLMTGPKGIGKATLAYRFARYILSQGAVKAAEAPSLSLFGEALAPEPAPTKTDPLFFETDTPIFRRVAAHSHTDLLTLSPAYDAKKHIEKSIITVDEARKVPEFLNLTPAEGDWRVVIVDAVDQLNPNAANALLKILEEPPARAMLLLVCHEAGGILPTIRSRCRSFGLSAPSHPEFSEILNTIAPSIEQHDYAALYALSYGSPGHAITLYQERGLEWYEGWLAAMQPAATPETRQKFADQVAAQKSPSTWDAVIHSWQVAMHRLTMFPHHPPQPIFRKESDMLAAIANATPPTARSEWHHAGQRLIQQTETFNLDKRHSIRMLADLAQLNMLAA
jgi:DNA polymerase-3 subunit delta'